ncbi:MAG: ATP-binding cassette domain-containing protein [Huintestinicola sp.]
MTLRGIVKSFGDKAVLKGIDLDIPRGGVTWIMGPSGCGKTTLLRIIAGLEQADGEIAQRPEGRVSMVFQELRLFEELNAAENCALAAKHIKHSEICRVLEETGLSPEDISRPVKKLSGGMKRRTDICRALCSESELLLMDEPFSGLDAESRERTAGLILKMQNGRTVVAVTHDPEDTVLIKGKVIYMNDGKIEKL